MNTMEMQTSATRAADLMKALSSENRLMILCQLAGEEKTVGRLAEDLGLRQAAVSQQLALLRKDGLVAARRDGRSIHYRLSGREARAVITLLYELYCAPAQQTVLA
ncbi:helix-turn-helix transcriptional regulator [Pelagibius litoralis]|uniref:Helix-turn-helix transcriptional regulator n=2 Tax=Pelagibius litoralis TaxID=374515 RepID=A0A967F0D8_9PROT|nr:helix-turn-helix transcriptional regulator [Pelagibius litoralis]